MKIFKGLCIFAAGALVGAAVAAKAVREKYQQEAEEEIAEMREYYREKMEKTEEPEQVTEEAKEETESEYKEIVKEKGYTNYTQYNDTESENNKIDDDVEDEWAPCIIDVEEFGEDPSYDTATLTYFKDGVLADEVDEVMDPKMVGEENLKIFDEFGARAIYVRNEEHMIDFEIIRDEYPYSEYTFYNLGELNEDKKPHQL